MRKYRSILAVIVLSIFALSLLAGCKSKPEEAGKKSDQTDNFKGVEINYWIIDWGGQRIPIHKKLVENFNNENPGIRVKLSAIGPEAGITPYDTKLTAAIVGGNAPDLIMVAGRTDLPAAVEAGFLADITDYLENDKNFDKNIYYESKFEEMKYKGRIYALPETMNVSGILAYNKTMFKDSGLDPNSPPRTLDELDAMAEKLTKTDGNGNYIQIGFYPWEWLLSMPESIVAPFGGSWWDENGKPTPLNPNNIKAFEWVMKYVNKYGFEKVNSFAGPNGAMDAGKLAMVYHYDFGIAETVRLHDSIELGVAPFPSVSDDIDPTWLGGWCVAVCAESKNKAEAVEFLKYHTGLKGQTFLIEEYGKININWQSPVIEANMIKKDSLHPINQFVIEVIFPSVKPRYYPHVSRQYLDSIKNIVKDVASGKGEMLQLLQDIDRKANAVEGNQ